MPVKILWDSDNDAAVLVDSEFEVPLGRVFYGHGHEKAEAFLAWYEEREKRGEYGSIRNLGLTGLARLQDEWLASLDDGCGTCGAPPWEACDTEDNPHERKFVRCGARDEKGCRRAAKFVDDKGGTWCTVHAPSGRRVVGIKTRTETSS